MGVFASTTMDSLNVLYLDTGEFQVDWDWDRPDILERALRDIGVFPETGVQEVDA